MLFLVFYRLFAIFYTVIYYYFAPFIVTGLVVLSQILINEGSVPDAPAGAEVNDIPQEL